MTEEKKSMVPKLRFPEFTETWEQRKLEELASKFTGGGTPNTSNPNYWNGEIPWIQSSDLKEDDVLSLTVKKHISQEGLKNSATKIVPKNSLVIVTRVGVGKLVVNTQEIATSQDFLSLSGIKGDSRFLAYSLYSLLKKITRRVQGTSIKGITKTDFLKETILVPALEEQEKISSCMVEVDKLITLHQRKLDVLNKLKKYLLQKMFPENGQLIPELRFPAFSGAWEQRKLSEIVRMNARIGWQNLRQSEFLDDGDFLLITGTDFKNGRVNFGTCHYIAKERFDQDPKIQVEEGSILLTKDGTIGKVALVDKLSKPATLNAGVYNIVPKNRVVESRFLFQYLSAPFLLDYVNKAATGGTIKHLNQSILVDFPVSFPSVAEQEKIGKFLEGIDHVTTLHQRKLEGLRKLKKSLLQQMFV